MKKPHVLDEEDIRYLQNNDYEEKPSKKPALWIFIFLIALIGLFGLVHFLDNFIVSEIVEDQVVSFRDLTIVFQKGSLKKFQKEYLSNQHREIKACLSGKKIASTYYIDKVYFPKLLSSSVMHVEAYACSEDTLIDLHSHPVNKCIASEQDIKVLNKLKKNNPDFIMLIMCGKERFALVK